MTSPCECLTLAAVGDKLVPEPAKHPLAHRIRVEGKPLPHDRRRLRLVLLHLEQGTQLRQRSRYLVERRLRHRLRQTVRDERAARPVHRPQCGRHTLTNGYSNGQKQPNHRKRAWCVQECQATTLSTSVAFP